ncbi:MAG: hypothetical protein QXN55_00040 [Candidatus Nitrosotenuis sp.]
MLELPIAVITAMFFTGWVPFIFSIVLAIILILSIASEEFGIGIAAFLIYLCAMAVFTPANPFVWIWHNLLELIGGMILYLVIDAIYSTIKYWSFLKQVVNIMHSLKIQFIEQYKVGIAPTEEMSENQKEGWQRHLRDNLTGKIYTRYYNGLKPSQNKGLISGWIAFWPFSAVGLFIADPFRDLVNAIYNHLISIYDKMYSNVITSKININDLK